MTFFVLVLLVGVIALNGLALWAFVRFNPAPGGGGQSFFNTVTFIVTPAISAVFSFWVHGCLLGRVDPRWLPFFAALAWPAAFPVVLSLAAVVRHLLFGRPPVENAGPRRPSAY
jgi:hypothetical protein